MRQGQNKSSIKKSNRALALEYLLTKRACSRIELSHVTGLSKMTATNIIDEFMRAGLIETGGPQSRNLTGRKPVSLRPADGGPLVGGIYIARNRIQAILCDCFLNPIDQMAIPLENENLASFTKKLNDCVDFVNSVRKRPLWGIGVATVGPVDGVRGVLLNPPDFYGIQGFELKAHIHARADVPVVVENDMTAAAQAEQYHGAGRKYQDFIYVGLSAGVGSGFISQRKLYQPREGLAGEFGHMGVDKNGIACPCGRRGCVERYTSIPILRAALRERTGEDLPFEAYCKRDEPRVREVLDGAVDALSYAIVNYVNILNPDAVIIGHEGVHLPERSMSRLAVTVNQDKLWGAYSEVTLHRAHFGSESSVYGAVCSVLSKWFEGDLPKTLRPLA